MDMRKAAAILLIAVCCAVTSCGTAEMDVLLANGSIKKAEVAVHMLTGEKKQKALKQLADHFFSSNEPGKAAKYYALINDTESRKKAGELYVESGDIDKAVELFASLNADEQLIDLGFKLIENGNIEAALASFGRAEAHLKIFQVIKKYHYEGDFDYAVYLYEKAQDDDLKYVAMGDSFFVAENFKAARNCYEQAGEQGLSRLDFLARFNRFHNKIDDYYSGIIDFSALLAEFSTVRLSEIARNNEERDFYYFMMKESVRRKIDYIYSQKYFDTLIEIHGEMFAALQDREMTLAKHKSRLRIFNLVQKYGY